MSIESFHRTLHAADSGEPLLTNLRAITKIEDAGQILSAQEDALLGNWSEWTAFSAASDPA